MENMQATRKWSELHGIAILSLADGKKVGTLDDFYFDLATSTIYALRIKTGLFSHKLLHVAKINTIGQDAITTANEDLLSNEAEDTQLSSLGLAENLVNYKIMSASGNVVGKVGDILLDTTTPTALRIAAFEVSGGLRGRISGHHHTFSAAQLSQYGHDVLIIPDEVAQSLQ